MRPGFGRRSFGGVGSFGIPWGCCCCSVGRCDAKTLQKIGIHGVDIYLRVGGKFIILLLS